MIDNNILVYDFETGSKYPQTTQPIQLAAIVIDIKTLSLIEGSTFKSLMKPVFDDAKCAELGIDPLQDEALAVNHITREELQDAPETKLVWNNFVEYTKNYNLSGNKGSQWDAVVPAGYNNSNFDDVIIRRLCEQHKPKLDKYGKCPLFHPFHNFDVQHDIARWFHYTKISNNNSVSLDTVREYMGIDKENAHDALKDVLDTAHLLIKFLRLIRNLYLGEITIPKGKRIQFTNCFSKENEVTKGIIENYE